MRDIEFRIRVGGRDFWVFRVWGGGGGGHARKTREGREFILILSFLLSSMLH